MDGEARQEGHPLGKGRVRIVWRRVVTNADALNFSRLPIRLQNIQQDTMAYLKKRAAIEEEYGKSMLKLALSMGEQHAKGVGKQGYVRVRVQVRLVFVQ